MHYALQITINRPEKRNAFTPRTGAWAGQLPPPRLHLSFVLAAVQACCCLWPASTRIVTTLFCYSPCPGHAAVMEMSWCFADAREDPAVGVIILTGEGPLAFCRCVPLLALRCAYAAEPCLSSLVMLSAVGMTAGVGRASSQALHEPLPCSGGDQSVRGAGGYVGADGIPRLNVLDLQMQARKGGGDGCSCGDGCAGRRELKACCLLALALGLPHPCCISAVCGHAAIEAAVCRHAVHACMPCAACH